jgi:hypothetical protein
MGFSSGHEFVLSVVISHDDGIDLPLVGQGFAVGRSDEEIDTL